MQTAMEAGNHNIVVDWLRSLNLLHYTQAFLDNGYDDLEVCKQIGSVDLDAIDVRNQLHREALLNAVKVLREEGGTNVYFTLEASNKSPVCHPFAMFNGNIDRCGDKSVVSCRKTDTGSENCCNNTLEIPKLPPKHFASISYESVIDEQNKCSLSNLLMDNTLLGGNALSSVVPTSFFSSAPVCATQSFFTTPITMNMVSNNSTMQRIAGAAGLINSNSVINASIPRIDSCTVGNSNNFMTFSKLQLRNILQEQLYDDNVCLTDFPYTTQNGGLCQRSLTALATKYAEILKTHVGHVVEYLEQLWYSSHSESEKYLSYGSMHMQSTLGPLASQYEYGLSHHGLPPPLPSCPPPSASHLERCADIQSDFGNRYDLPGYQNYVALDGEGASQVDGMKKKGSTIGRFLRNLGIRKSGRKSAYRQHGDLMAYEITMGDDDRVALMQMVKQGIISTETAVTVVKQFEEEQRKKVHEEGKENHVNGMCIGKKGTLKKKKGFSKPIKSQSAVYSAGQRCNVCHVAMSPADYEQPANHSPCDHQLANRGSRQRRVYSVSHFDCSGSVDSLGFSHTPPCSTMCMNPILSPFPPSTVRQFHTPPPSQTGLRLATFGHVEQFKGRLASGKGKSSSHTPKTLSQTSLLSSSSEQSTDYSHQFMPVQSHAVTTTVDGSVLWGGRGGNSIASLLPDFTSAPSSACNDSNEKIMKDSDLRPEHLPFTPVAVFLPAQPDPASCLCPTTLLSGSVPPLAPYNSAAHAGAFIGIARAKTDFVPLPGDSDSLSYKKGDIIHIMATTPDGLGRGTMRGIVGGFALSNVDILGMPQCMPQQKTQPSLTEARHQTVDELMSELGLQNLTKTFLDNGFDTLEILSEIDDDCLTTLGIEQPEWRSKVLSAVERLTTSVSSEVHFSLAVPATCNRSPPWRTSLDLLSHTVLPTSCITLASDTSKKGLQSGRYSGCCNSGSNARRPLPQKYRCFHPAVQLNKCLCRQCGKPKAPAGAELSAEDQEVSFITKDSLLPQHQLNSAGITVNSTTVVNTAISNSMCSDCSHANSRSESKSSKQSLSSACTQLTSLSPEEEAGMYEKHAGPIRPDLSGGHSHNVTVGRLEPGCVQCMQEAALLTSQMAGQESSLQQERSYGYCPYAWYMSYNSSHAHGETRADCGLISSDYHHPLQDAHPHESLPNHYRYHYGRYGTGACYPIPNCCHGPGHPPPSHYPGYYRRDQLPSGFGPVGSLNCPPIVSRMPLSTCNFGRRFRLNRSQSHDSGSDMYPAGVNPHGSVPAQAHSPRSSGSGAGRSVIPFVTTKLKAEGILLTDQPYSSINGECGIPPLLVQRYTEELHLDVLSVALVMEQIRTVQLHALQRSSVPNELLAEKCGKKCNLQISSLADFFLSIGLPMYAAGMSSAGVDSVHKLLRVTEADIPSLTGADSRHVKRIAHAIEWVRDKLGTAEVRDRSHPETDGIVTSLSVPCGEAGNVCCAGGNCGAGYLEKTVGVVDTVIVRSIQDRV